eukprot:7086977-Heterocapsa_arctica.AAC.1
MDTLAYYTTEELPAGFKGTMALQPHATITLGRLDFYNSGMVDEIAGIIPGRRDDDFAAPKIPDLE